MRTTPFSYESLENVFADLSLHTLQVKTAIIFPSILIFSSAVISFGTGESGFFEQKVLRKGETPLRWSESLLGDGGKLVVDGKVDEEVGLRVGIEGILAFLCCTKSL
jgi:hypothetical protein